MKVCAAWIATLLAVLIMPGCGTSPAANFYSLTANTLAVPAQPGNPYRVQITRTTVPELVDRPQLVLRHGAHQVTIEEYARWADPLKNQIPRAVADNLAKLLGGAQVFVYPQASDADCLVALNIERFDSMAGDAVTVEVWWTVQLPRNGASRSGRSAVHEAVSGDGYDALVAAHARALAAVSQDIARAMDLLRSSG
jgi:uncharacterized protein